MALYRMVLVLGLVLSALLLRAQTYVTAPMTGTPAAGSYYSNTSITLSPNFSFTAGAGSSLTLYITNPDCVPQNITPSADQNYIIMSVPRTGGFVNGGTGLNTGDFANRSTCELMQTVQYFDGLGRPLQTVQVKGSPSDKDMVQPFAFDAYGRQAVKYLPYTSPSADGSYKSTAISAEIGNFYYPSGSTAASGDQQSNSIVYNPVPNSKINFELSPLGRVVEQGAPGHDWQPGAGHTLKIAYTYNNNNTFSGADTAVSMLVALYSAAVNSDQSRTLTRGNYYQPGQISVTVSKDENWKSGRGGTTEEYKDNEGHIVLKRIYNFTGGVLQQLSTYYVYDDFGNLAFVLPPMSGADNAAPSQSTLDNLCYQYRYDERNRLVAKKIPGKDWEYLIYNPLNQVVATQDGSQRTNNQWVFTKYDALGRVIETGIWTNGNTAISPTTLQATVNSQTSFSESRSPGSYYTTNSWPTTWDGTLTINYYDDYSYPDKPAGYAMPSGAMNSPRGLLTGTKTHILNTSGEMLWTVDYYDALGRVLKTYKQHYLGGAVNENNYDEIDNSYDFTNEVTASTRTHHAVVSGKNTTLTIANNYSYDHMGRKTQTLESIGGATPIVLSQTDYNEIGQLKAKHLHSTNGGSSFLQDINYTYNERGWLKTSSSLLFAMQLNYNDASGTSAQYNGNIANQLWGTPGTLNKNYTYSYDQLNRLTSGVGNTGNTENNISYDLMGNIQTMSRSGQANQTLTYTYTGNQLSSVNNGSNSFRSYAYDNNGNATSDGQGHTITYNLLNLPQTVTLSNGTLTYTYDAEGNKLRKVSTIGSGSSEDYISGIQYKTDGSIDFIQTEEGRAINNNGTYTYEYNLADHLGNTRVSFDQHSGTTATQQDDYYPFGMEISSGAVSSPKNEYLYNKKELQEELGQYDYGARLFDPVIARWTTPDPRSEKFPGLTPYSYVGNNPILLNDPTGMDWTITMDTDKDGIKHYHITFTGDVVNQSSNKKINGDKFAKALTDQFNKVFNKSDSKDGYTIDAHAEISYVGDDLSNTTETHTRLLIVDSNDSDFDGAGATTPGKEINGLEVKFNADFVPGMMPDKNGHTKNSKTGPHEIGHTAGLKHPDMDTYLWGLIPGSTNYLGPVQKGGRTIFPIENFMNQGGQGTWQWTHPTGPSKEQVQRMYDLYKSNKLNNFSDPIEQ